MTMGVEATAVKYTSEGKANSTFKRSSSQNGSAILGVNVCTHNPCKCKHSKFSITIMVPILLSTISYHLKHHLLCSGWDYGAHANVDIFTESDLYWKWHLPTNFPSLQSANLMPAYRPVGGVAGCGAMRGGAAGTAISTSGAAGAATLCSPRERSCHNALRLEISRMLSPQHFMASLWYRIWLAAFEDHERKTTVVSPPLPPAGCDMYPRRGKSWKAFVKTSKACMGNQHHLEELTGNVSPAWNKQTLEHGLLKLKVRLFRNSPAQNAPSQRPTKRH